MGFAVCMVLCHRGWDEFIFCFFASPSSYSNESHRYVHTYAPTFVHWHTLYSLCSVSVLQLTLLSNKFIIRNKREKEEEKRNNQRMDNRVEASTGSKIHRLFSWFCEAHGWPGQFINDTLESWRLHESRDAETRVEACARTRRCSVLPKRWANA